MFEEAGSRLGWRTGASRHLKMKPQLDVLQSFDPGERAEAGRELVEMGLTRTAHALLDHVENEFDDRVLAAIASAVRAAPVEEDESRRARQLREWAVSELDRLRLEDAFMSGTATPPAPPAPEPAPAPTAAPEPPVETPAVSLEEIRAELPIRLPGRPTRTVPSIPTAPAATTAPAAVPGTSWVAPSEPTAAMAPAVDGKKPLPYIRWRAPIELTTTTTASSAGPAQTRIPTAAAPPIAVRFEAPSEPPPSPEPPESSAPPAESEQEEVRFETPTVPAPVPPATTTTDPPPSSSGLTLAERLKARAGTL